MSKKLDAFKIDNPKLDKRVKLLPKQKDNIKELYLTGNYSQRNLADTFKASKRTIQFILDPKKLAENKMRREERGGWEQYYDKEVHRNDQQKYRDHKRAIIGGKIK